MIPRSIRIPARLIQAGSPAAELLVDSAVNLREADAAVVVGMIPGGGKRVRGEQTAEVE